MVITQVEIGGRIMNSPNSAPDPADYIIMSLASLLVNPKHST